MTTTLAATLSALAEVRDHINEQIAATLTDAPVTDERRQYTITDDWRSRNDRYVLIMPDGLRYNLTPEGRFIVTGFKQKPAALRAATGLPGCRVLDVKTDTIVEA